MLNTEQCKNYITKFIHNTYTEASIGNLKKKLNDFVRVSHFNDTLKDEFFITVMESIVAGKSLFLAQNAKCFSYSSMDAGVILCLSKVLLSVKEYLLLNSREIQFLENLSYFKKIFELEKKLTFALKNELLSAANLCRRNGVRFSYILTLCAYVEHLILENYFSHTAPAFSSNSKDTARDQLSDYSTDEIISALGLIVSISNDIPTINTLPNAVFPEYASSKRSKKILLLACRIRFLQELQQENEQFGYACEYKNGILSLHLNEANCDLLQDYRLGYIKRKLSNDNYLSSFSERKLPSFKEIVDICGNKLVREKVENPSRYRLRINSAALEQICKTEELTREEYDSIFFETEELNLNNRFLNKPIYKDLTLLEYIQLRRIFIIFFHAQVVPTYNDYSAGIITKEEYFQSLVPCLDNTIFDRLRSNFGNKVDTFLQLNNYKETNSKIVDLQYQPLMSKTNSRGETCPFYALCSVAAISNIGRNTIKLLKTLNSSLINDDGVTDPLINSLATTFQSKGIPNIEGKDIGNKTDIDFAFLIGKTIYIAECKRNILPTDIFECRTTIDAIHKAERQIDRILYELNNQNLKQDFLRQFGLKSSEEVNIVAFIITGNRVFSNTNEFHYPVCYFKEFIRFVESGTIIIGEKQISVQKSGKLCEDDMSQFLSKFSPFRFCFSNSMMMYQITFNHPKLKISIDDFALNIVELDKYCKSCWNASPLNPEYQDQIYKNEF